MSKLSISMALDPSSTDSEGYWQMPRLVPDRIKLSMTREEIQDAINTPKRMAGNWQPWDVHPTDQLPLTITVPLDGTPMSFNKQEDTTDEATS